MSGDAIYKGLYGNFTNLLSIPKMNVLSIKLTCLAFLSYSLLFHVFEAVLKRFQRVSAGGGVSLQKRLSNPGGCDVL